MIGSGRDPLGNIAAALPNERRNHRRFPDLPTHVQNNLRRPHAQNANRQPPPNPP
jgi:hypothetical protein